MQNPTRSTDRSYVPLILRSWGVLVMMLFAYMPTDGYHSAGSIHLAKQLQNSDYNTTFYVSGPLAVAHKLDLIYPPPESTALSGSPYNRLAHQVMPDMTPSLTAVCPYFPLVPFIFSPLSLLQPHWAFLAFAALSVLALFASCRLLDALGATQKVSSFWWSLLYFPVAHCIFIGQSDIMLGLLPLTIGYFALRKNRPYLAGVAWALTFLKPQFFLSIAFFCVMLLFRQKHKPLLALICGSIALCVTNLVIFGPHSFEQWLGGMRAVERVYSDAHNGVVVAIVACLPRMILLSLPTAMHIWVKPLVYALSAAFVLIAALACRNFARSDASAFDYECTVMLIALCLIPFVAPHLFYYDLSAFVLAAIAFAIAHEEPHSTAARFGLSLRACWVGTNLYVVLLLGLSKFASPWPLLLLYLEMYRRLIITAWRRRSDALVSTSAAEDTPIK